MYFILQAADQSLRAKVSGMATSDGLGPGFWHPPEPQWVDPNSGPTHFQECLIKEVWGLDARQTT